MVAGVLQFSQASSLRTVVVLSRRPACPHALRLPRTSAVLPGVAPSFSDQPTPAVKTQVACLITETGLCLLADAAVATITPLPLLSSQGPAYVDILVASQFADAAILIPTIRLPASWTTLW
jgi:hypothetical protein